MGIIPGPSDCCGGNDCNLNPHAASGWCLASTGEPVIVITTLICPFNSVDDVVTVILVDPSTGNQLPPQPIVACGDKDWEINQLCDYDPETGELIATFTQVFEWDEDTETLIITNVRSDDPTIPYVPVGSVRECNTPRVDIEMVKFCYSDEIVPDSEQGSGWAAWTFLDGVHTATVYFDHEGTILVNPTVEACVDVDSEIISFCYDDGSDLPATGIRQMVFVDGVYTHSHFFTEDGIEIFAPTIVPCIEQQSIVDIVGSDNATVARLTNVDNITQQCIPANPDRRHLILVAEGGGTILVKFGSGVTATSYTVIIPANGVYELPHPQIYTGIVCVIKSTGGTNNVQYTEVLI